MKGLHKLLIATLKFYDLDLIGLNDEIKLKRY